MACRYAAGASDLPFAVLRGYRGTDLVAHTNVKPIACPFTGEQLTAVPALRPDVAIVHAQEADRRGKVQLWGIPGVQKEALLVYESGTIGAKPQRIPLSIGDGELAATADAVVSVPEMFSYWIIPGRIDVAFLGAAQVDRFANLNSTVIGDYGRARTRLPGAGGAPEIAAGCGEVVVIAPHSRRTFVQRLDFVTTVGHGDGPSARERLGLRGAGPTAVITDLGVLEPHAETRELVLTQVHDGVEIDEVREATGAARAWRRRSRRRGRSVPATPRSSSPAAWSR